MARLPTQLSLGFWESGNNLRVLIRLLKYFLLLLFVTESQNSSEWISVQLMFSDPGAGALASACGRFRLFVFYRSPSKLLARDADADAGFLGARTNAWL